MKTYTSDVAFSPAVKSVQERLGSRGQYAGLENRGGFAAELSADLIEFIARRDSFYMATASAEGQPYIQHRGGPPGFLKVLDDRTLAFADFSGNRQYITVGNLGENDRAQLFLMDYANQTRVKVWGRARVVEDDPRLIERLLEEGYRGRPERAIVFEIEAWDINCPQHIVKRYSEKEVESMVKPLQTRIEELESQLARVEAS